MATAEKNVSPEERLLNVIRGKDGKDSKDTKSAQAASDAVDEVAPPLDEAPPPEPSPTVRITRPPAAASTTPSVSTTAPSPSVAVSAATPSAASSASSTSAPAAEAQTTGPRTRGPLGDEKLKAALSRKVAERTKGEDKSGGPATIRSMGGAAGAIARAAAQESSSPAPSRPASVPSSEPARLITKKVQGDSAPGIRYVSMGFAAIIVIVVMFSAYEIVAAINLDPIPKPPEERATVDPTEDLLGTPMSYNPLKTFESFRKKDMFREIVINDPKDPQKASVRWMETLGKNFVVIGRLGDPNKGGELILRDNRDNRQYFVGVGGTIQVDEVAVSFMSVGNNGAMFGDGVNTKELPIL